MHKLNRIEIKIQEEEEVDQRTLFPFRNLFPVSQVIFLALLTSNKTCRYKSIE